MKSPEPRPAGPRLFSSDQFTLWAPGLHVTHRASLASLPTLRPSLILRHKRSLGPSNSSLSAQSQRPADPQP